MGGPGAWILQQRWRDTCSGTGCLLQLGGAVPALGEGRLAAGRPGRGEAAGENGKSTDLQESPMASPGSAPLRYLSNSAFLCLPICKLKRVTDSSLKVIAKITEANGCKALGRALR